MGASLDFDVVVIGSGATGGWAAKELAESGMNVCVLEAGPELTAKAAERFYQPRPATEESAAGGKDTGRARGPSAVSNPEMFRVSDDDHPYSTPKDMPFDWYRARCLGGRSNLWGAVTLRLSNLDFKAASRDGFGEDWPISYEDLSPFYDEVESFLGVQGSVEHLPQLPDGCYLPALPMTPAENALKAILNEKSEHLRLIVGRGVPGRAGTGEVGWPRFSSLGSTLAAALGTGKVTLKCDTIVHRVHLDPFSGRAKSVSCVDGITHRNYEIRARVFVLCASTIESTRILLNSACSRHPDGLGNSSGVLGRFLMDHPSLGIEALVSDYPAPTELSFLRGPSSVLVPRFRNLAAPDAGYLRGFQLWGGVQRKLRLPRKLQHDGANEFLFYANLEMLPRHENRVSINKDVSDRWGIPTVHIECQLSENEKLMAADAILMVDEIRQDMNAEATNIRKSLVPGSYIHEVGTARMGSDPKSSVLDSNNRCWDVENVFVTDGACFVSGGCQNPTLTMMALTLRASRFIVQELKSGNL